jgi:L-asparagine transporter-like permease
LLIVIVSYRQTIKAYPDGGGAFIVANDNLGIRTGTVAASALLVDYVLTVSVSVAAGVAAITSAAPDLIPWRVEIALGFVALLTIANLRGVKEASTLFAVPTYLFVITVGIMLVMGFVERMDGTCPQAISSGEVPHQWWRGWIVPRVEGLRLWFHGLDRRRGDSQRGAGVP